MSARVPDWRRRRSEGRPRERPRKISTRYPGAVPCVGICRLDDAGASCTGCGRTLDEVAKWSGATDDYKRAVWRRIAAMRDSGHA